MNFDNLAGVEWGVACIWYFGVFLIVNGSQHVSATSTYLCEKIWTQWMQRMWEWWRDGFQWFPSNCLDRGWVPIPTVLWLDGVQIGSKHPDISSEVPSYSRLPILLGWEQKGRFGLEPPLVRVVQRIIWAMCAGFAQVGSVGISSSLPVWWWCELWDKVLGGRSSTKVSTSFS